MKNFTFLTNKTWGVALALALTFMSVKLSAQIEINLDLQEPTCNGYSNGQARVSPSGGASPYSFEWSSGHDGKVAWSLKGGDYGVTVTDANGQQVSESFTLNQPDELDVDIALQGDACTSATYVAVVTGGSPEFSYKWNTGATTASIQNMDETFLGVNVTDIFGCTSYASMSVSAPFSIDLEVNDISCKGYGDGTAILDISGGKAPFDIKWSTGSGDDGNMYISDLDAGDYSVEVTDANGCTLSASGTVINPEKGVVTIIKDKECGLPVTVTATIAGGIGPHMFMWVKDGDVIANNEGVESTHIFEEKDGAQTLYLCVMNAYGCPNDNWVTVAPGFELNAEVKNTKCNDAVGSINLSPTSIVGPAVYEWEGPNGFTSDKQDIENLEKGTYTCNVTDAGGCTATYSTTIGEDGVAADIDMDKLSNKQCGHKVTLNNTNGNSGDFHWELPDGTVIDDIHDFTGSNQGEATVLLVLNDDDGCTEPVPYKFELGAPALADFDFELKGCLESIDFTDNSSLPSDATGWTWVFGSDALTYKEQNPTLPGELVDGETLSAKLIVDFPDGCSVTVEKNIDIVSIPDTIPSSALICDEGGSVILNPGGNDAYTYTWTPVGGGNPITGTSPAVNPDSDQAYSVVITDTNGAQSCSVTQEVNVVVAPIMLETTGDTTLCDASATAPITATQTGDDFAWYQNGSPVSTALNLNAAPGTYIATSTNAAGCVRTNTIIVKAEPMNNIKLEKNSFSLCNDEVATLQIPMSSLTATDKVEWFDSDGVLVATDNPFVVGSGESGEYTVVVTSEDGCTASDAAQIDIFEIDVEAGVSPKKIVRGQTADLSATGNYMTYEWSPDDGSINNPNTAEPEISPSETTTYYVTATDINGCKAIDSITIEVENTECGEPYIYLPNAFTPNGDGNGNDILYLEGLNLTDIQLSIYNRWGQLVFETFDQSVGWDGTFNGEPVVPDVYGFYLRVVCDNGEKYFKKGNITVLK